MKVFYPASCLFLFVVLLSSCSLQRRHYRDGYHVQWTTSTEQLADRRNTVTEEKIELQPIDPRNIDLTASLRGNEILLPAKVPVVLNETLGNLQPDNAEECDIIVQKNGKELKAKVIEINTESIKYKDCDGGASVEEVIKRSDISKIRYSNGTEEVFADHPKEDLTKAERIERNTKNLSVFTLILGILSLVPFYGIFPGVLAFIFGNIAVHKYKKNGMTEKRVKKFALTGLLLGLAGAVVSFCLIILSFFEIL